MPEGRKTTIYVGGLMEKVIGASGTDYHHMIRAGSALIVVSRSTGSNNDTYWSWPASVDGLVSSFLTLALHRCLIDLTSSAV